LARASLVFVGILLCDIRGSFSVATASGAVTTEAPQWHHRQQGRIPDGAHRPLSRHGDSDAPIAAEVHSFVMKIKRQIAPAFATRLRIQKFESFRSSQAVQSWGVISG
jgi:hypothetical protein